MENSMKNFDDLFRDELAEYAETPPGRVWDNLEKRLNATAAVGKAPYGKGWYWMVGVASVAVLLSFGWNMANKDTAPAVAPIAQTETAVANKPEQPAAASTEEADNTVKPIVAPQRHARTANQYEQTGEQDADEVSAYGNAAATGTNLHSYDDFDERAVASGSKQPAPLNSNEEHAANGYKINKIRKHRLMAAEMVPTHQQRVYASAAKETAKPVEMQKTTANRPPVRTVATKVASSNTKKAVVIVNEANEKANHIREAVAANQNINTATQETATASNTVVAEKPAAASPLPVPASTATAAKSKPASEIIVPAKPTTGGSEPTKADSPATADKDANGATEEDKKGLFGIFKKKKK